MGDGASAGDDGFDIVGEDEGIVDEEGMDEGIDVGYDDVDGSVEGMKEGMNEGADDTDGSIEGVDDHDEIKGSQIGLRSPLLDPLVCVLKNKDLLLM